MKVHSVSNQNISTKGLRICYDAESRLRNADASLITALFKVGKANEANQYIDILVMKNLSFKIKEKANQFFCLREPMYLKKASDNKVNIIASYDGVETDEFSKGDKYKVGIELDSVEEAVDAVKKFNDMNGLQRISYIAKLIEDYFVKTKSETYPIGGKRNSVVTLLMDKYGDIVV